MTQKEKIKKFLEEFIEEVDYDLAKELIPKLILENIEDDEELGQYDEFIYDYEHTFDRLYEKHFKE